MESVRLGIPIEGFLMRSSTRIMEGFDGILQEKVQWPGAHVARASGILGLRLSCAVFFVIAGTTEIYFLIFTSLVLSARGDGEADYPGE